MGSTQIALTGGSRLSQPPSPWPHRERGAPSPPLRSSCSESGLSARRARRLGAPGPTLPVMRLPGPSPPPWGWGVGGPGVSPTLSGSPPSPAHEAPSPRLLWGCQGGRVRLLLGELGGWGRPGRGRGGGAPPVACLPPAGKGPASDRGGLLSVRSDRGASGPRGPRGGGDACGPFRSEAFRKTAGVKLQTGQTLRISSVRSVRRGGGGESPSPL